jgi:transposase
VRDLPILGKEVYLELTVQQFICDNCKRQFSEKFKFVAEGAALTKRMGRYLYEYMKKESLAHVSGRENINWNVLQNIFTNTQI